MTRVLLVGDTSNRANWGCRATSLALKTMIAERATLVAAIDTQTWPAVLGVRTTDRGAETAGFGSRFAFETSSPLDRDGLLAFKARFGNKGTCFLRNVEAHMEAYRAHNYGGLNDAMEAADVILLNGEGAVMDRRAPARRMFFLLHYNAARFQRKIAIVNHTADLADPELRAFAGSAYPKADAVRVREMASLAQVSALAGVRGASFAADAAFMLRPAGPPRADGLVNAGLFAPDRPYVCVGGTARWKKDAVSLNDEADFLAMVERIRRHIPVVLVAAGSPEDEVFARAAAAMALPLAPPEFPTQSAVNLLAGASAYVGGRWHTAISSLNAGTPVVLFESNSAHKSAGLAALFGGDVDPPLLAQGLAVLTKDVLAALDRILERGASLRASLSGRAEALRGTAPSNVDVLELST